ncbi:ShlB/FhaC/HecB family hemolysin secretion/activation protein [Acinetobacter haemolyticus]|uniref:ShlB/FhaC/HecB family hemolysin secretion/activation protein n=1 Tax=Acinetobacter haemolyticus TaxID=29430 RepID=UPI0024DE00A8|nr:POTRA domain-containing protein [Acinetobacter haemolyticus]
MKRYLNQANKWLNIIPYKGISYGFVGGFLCFCSLLHAEVTVPDSGTITRQLNPELLNQKDKADQQYFETDYAQEEYSRDKTPIWITKVQIEGNQQIETAILHELAATLENKNNVLADLQHAVAQITQYYKNRGYFLARAYLPKQKIEDGVLIIKVLEGQLGKVIINNQSMVKYSVLDRFTQQIPKNQALQQTSSNKALLMISDLAGVESISANLQAGESLGQTDLLLDVYGQKKWLGRLGLDNTGSTYTGLYRASGYLESLSMMGYGEKLSAQILASDQNLISGSLNAQFPITGYGLWVGGGYSRTEYELGEQFKLLDAKGTSENYNLNFTYPFIRGQKTNLNLKLMLEKRNLFDEIAITNTETSKQTYASRISFNLSQIDDWGIGGVKGGMSQLELMTTIGDLEIQSPSALNIDHLSARTHGAFQKYELTLTRQQRLTSSSWIMAELYGQLASKNLDSSEKLSLKRMRAYPSAEALGDQGWGASINYYYQLMPFLHVILFKDIGQIQQNKNSYLLDKNSRYLSGAGVGFGGNYLGLDYNSTVAWRMTEAAQSDVDRQPRVQFSIGWRF